MNRPSPLRRSKRIAAAAAAAAAAAEKKAHSAKATKSTLAPTKKTSPPSKKSQPDKQDIVTKKAKHPQKVSRRAPAVKLEKPEKRKPHKAHVWTHSTDPDLAKIEKVMKPFAIGWAPGDDWWTERIVRDAAPLYQRLANNPPDPPQGGGRISTEQMDYACLSHAEREPSAETRAVVERHGGTACLVSESGVVGRRL